MLMAVPVWSESVLLPEIPRLHLVAPAPDTLPVAFCLVLSTEVSALITTAEVLAVGVGGAHTDHLQVDVAATRVDLGNRAAIAIQVLGPDLKRSSGQ